MGATQSRSPNEVGIGRQPGQQIGVRGQAITGGTTGRQRTGVRTRPANSRPVDELDYDFVINALGKLLLFTRTDPALVRKVVHGMWERDCDAGEHNNAPLRTITCNAGASVDRSVCSAPGFPIWASCHHPREGWTRIKAHMNTMLHAKCRLERPPYVHGTLSRP
jgi:hypothetical protein